MTPSANQNLQELQNARKQCLGSLFGGDRGSTAAPNNTAADWMSVSGEIDVAIKRVGPVRSRAVQSCNGRRRGDIRGTDQADGAHSEDLDQRPISAGKGAVAGWAIGDAETSHRSHAP